MRINTQDHNDITIMDLSGEFTIEFASSFRDVATGILSRGQAGIVLDMSNVGFIDSEGLESLLWLRDHCHDMTRSLKLAGLDENCSKILEVTRLGNELDSYVELAEAVKSFA